VVVDMVTVLRIVPADKRRVSMTPSNAPARAPEKSSRRCARRTHHYGRWKEKSAQRLGVTMEGLDVLRLILFLYMTLQPHSLHLIGSLGLIVLLEAQSAHVRVNSTFRRRGGEGRAHRHSCTLLLGELWRRSLLHLVVRSCRAEW
jgi:hypothetical protein